jgi:hypothetical protein
LVNKRRLEKNADAYLQQFLNISAAKFVCRAKVASHSTAAAWQTKFGPPRRENGLEFTVFYDTEGPIVLRNPADNMCPIDEIFRTINVEGSWLHT